MTVSLDQLAFPSDASTVITGVHNASRLRAVAEAKLDGHLGDRGLDAVVATLHVACNVPMAVVNVVTVDLQTYPAEVGVGALCTTVPDEFSFCASVVDHGKSLTVVDALLHPVFSQNPLVLAGAVGAYAGEPLLDNGFVIGAVSIFDNKPREFTTAELEILRHQALLASTVLALRRSARTDVLTGLPNRGLFLDRLTHALDRLVMGSLDEQRRHRCVTAVFQTGLYESPSAFGDGVTAGGLAPFGLDPGGLAPFGLALDGVTPFGLDPAGLAPFGLAPGGLAPGRLVPADSAPCSTGLVRLLRLGCCR